MDTPFRYAAVLHRPAAHETEFIDSVTHAAGPGDGKRNLVDTGNAPLPHLFVSMTPATLSMRACRRPATMKSTSSPSRKEDDTSKADAMDSSVTLLYDSRNCRTTGEGAGCGG